MIKENLRIKENITFDDKINAVEQIISSYFMDGDYTPWFAEIGETIAIVKNFIEGAEFEEGELIYETAQNDEEVLNLVEEVRGCSAFVDFVLPNVNKKVEFIKQKEIHRNDTMDKLGELFNVVTDAFENFSKLDLGKLSQDDIKTVTNIIGQLKDKDITTEKLTDVIKNAVGFDMDKASSEIIDAKNEEIRKLKEENKKLATILSAPNVLNNR